LRLAFDAVRIVKRRFAIPAPLVSASLGELPIRVGWLVVRCACHMSHLLRVTGVTLTMAVGGSLVVYVSCSPGCGSAGLMRYW
jgi:hypothetical protein